MSPKRRGYLNRKYVFQPLIFGGVHPQKNDCKKGVSGCKKKTKLRGLEDFLFRTFIKGDSFFQVPVIPFLGLGASVYEFVARYPLGLSQTTYIYNYIYLPFNLPKCMNVWGGRITYPTWGYVKIMCLRKRICSPNISGT